MKNVLVLTFSLLLLLGCSKQGFKKFETATWDKETDCCIDLIEGNYYCDALFDQKILRIQSISELQTIDSVVTQDLATAFASFDFTKTNLFIALFPCEGKESEVVTKSEICINESTNSILFDFKVKTNVGGSGMHYWSTLYYFTIPIDKAGYTMSGTIEMDEKSSVFQNDDHDYVRSYELI